MIAITDIQSLEPITGACNGIADGPYSIQLVGDGTLNDDPASFRVCLADNNHSGSSNGVKADQLYVECRAGCSYDTASRATSNELSGGNIQVDRATAAGASSAAAHTSSSQSTSSDADGTSGYLALSGGGWGSTEAAYDPTAPATMILDPVSLTSVVAGSALTLSVRVYDGYQQPLADQSVSIAIVSAGVTRTVSAVSDLTGTAVVPLTALPSGAEYIATAGSVQSNAISISPLGP